jgi:long-chain acyl-CoA synthetase
VFVIIESNIKARRLRYIIKNSGAKVLIARSNQVSIIYQALEELGKDFWIIWVGIGGDSATSSGVSGIGWDSIFSELPDTNSQKCAMEKDGHPRCIDIDLAALIYTSGTTGTPRGLMCTHQNMISAAKSIIQYISNRQDDIILNVLPLSFGYGLYQILTSIMFGGTVILERSFFFPHATLNRIAEEKVTGFPLVPSMAAIMLNMENISKYDLSTLRYITSAGDALPVRHLTRLRRLAASAQIFNMYGLTECVRVCYLEGKELDQRPYSVGKAMPNCEVRIVDNYGNEVEPGEIGELTIRGSNVMQGYWNEPQMSLEVYRPGDYPVSRWLYSGDNFRKDNEGYLYFVGRKNDMIKIAGERVSPREVEDVVCELQYVAEAAVVGVPDEMLGQVIKVFIVRTTDKLREEDVLKYCVSNLEPLLVPKYVEFVSDLHRNSHGKINRRKLQEKK